MSETHKIGIFLHLLIAGSVIEAFNCRNILQDMEIMYVNWDNLQKCLAEVNSEVLPSNTSANIWRLIKSPNFSSIQSFDGIENIPMEVYRLIGYTLTEIPLQELHNISMERIEIVDAFGAIRTSNEFQGFTAEQSSLIAQKVRNEWLGKNPETYSEYDLISMGEIVCQLNITDIEELHPDAFKNAAEWIGNIKNCPQNRLQAFAKLAKNDEAFGEPRKWSKLDVSVIGNIINGLTRSDIAAIDKKKLRLNRFYTVQDRNSKGGSIKNKIPKRQNDNSSSTE